MLLCVDSWVWNLQTRSTFNLIHTSAQPLFTQLSRIFNRALVIYCSSFLKCEHIKKKKRVDSLKWKRSCINDLGCVKVELREDLLRQQRSYNKTDKVGNLKNRTTLHHPPETMHALVWGYSSKGRDANVSSSASRTVPQYIILEEIDNVMKSG